MPRACSFQPIKEQKFRNNSIFSKDKKSDFFSGMTIATPLLTVLDKNDGYIRQVIDPYTYSITYHWVACRSTVDKLSLAAAKCFSVTGKNISKKFVKESLTMKSKKDNQHEILIIEITAWSLVIGILYIFAKAVFGL